MGSVIVDLFMMWVGCVIEVDDYVFVLDLFDVVVVLKLFFVEGWNWCVIVYYMCEDFGKLLVDIECILVLELCYWGVLFGLVII